MRPFHPEFILTAFVQIIPYLWVTIATMIGTVVFGSLIGLILARANIRRGFVSRVLAQAYIYITRCIPSIVMLFIVYYGLPELMLGFGIDLNNMNKGFFVIVTFSILFSANMAEVFRSAYETIDKGQREAALCAGLSEWQAFYRIVLPQCIVVALPNFTNALVNLMKEGSLSYTIGLIDVMGKGQLMIGQNFGSYSLETYLALTVIYWGLTVIMEKGFGGLEERISKRKKLAAAS
ncbi:MAG: amino acid ABC transporter permease [Eubacteriales bacterium]|nr:amino acid ABC transporter permease [Eubacteriales bacterium]